MTRLSDLKREEMSAEQGRIHDEITNGPRGVVQGPLKVWLHSPSLADRAQKLGQFVRFDSSLEPRLTELAIMVTGRYWTAQFEWHVHRGFALKAGLSEAVINALRDRQTPTFERRDEQVVYDFAMALHQHKKVSDSVYKAAVDELSEVTVVDLVGVLGYYTLISMTINAFEVPLPDGVEPELD